MNDEEVESFKRKASADVGGGLWEGMGGKSGGQRLEEYCCLFRSGSVCHTSLKHCSGLGLDPTTCRYFAWRRNDIGVQKMTGFGFGNAIAFNNHKRSSEMNGEGWCRFERVGDY